MNDTQRSMFDRFLAEMNVIAERVFNRKLSESALVREYNAMSTKLKKLETRSLNAATERSELLNMIREIKKDEPKLTPPTAFKPGEVVMVRDNDDNPWETEIFKHTSESEYPYQCSDEWRYCRKLNDKEKGL